MATDVGDALQRLALAEEAPPGAPSDPRFPGEVIHWSARAMKPGIAAAPAGQSPQIARKRKE